MTRTVAAAPVDDAGEHESAGDGAVSLAVPVRRSRWVSFWIGCAAVLASLLAAALSVGVLLLLPVNLDGALVVIAFATLWFGLFFLSLPWQKRYARSRDERRPGARLDGHQLTIPHGDKDVRFDLSAPHELTHGWFETVTKSTGGPTTNTRGFMTYAILAQDGRELFLQAEESVREAQAADWPNRTSVHTPARRVRFWAADLVALVEAVRRAGTPTTTTGPRIDMTQKTVNQPAGAEKIREWPGNPLAARNRHEATLFLEWMKVELISRESGGGGEVCVGRIRSISDPEVADTYRFVFALLAADPTDEQDYGPGTSRIFDSAELLLLLSRLEREEAFGFRTNDARGELSHLLTHHPTPKVESFRRANEQGAALIEQALRFAEGNSVAVAVADASPVTRKWVRDRPERFNVDALRTQQQRLKENAALLSLSHAEPGEKQLALVRALRELCPAYLEDLRRAGYEPEHYRHTQFSHAHHLTRFAARALRDGHEAQAREAFDAWAVAEPKEILFPTYDFADAVQEVGIEPEHAAKLVSPSNRNSFYTRLSHLADPDYNPWSY